jgi:thioredoxin 1
MKNFEFQRKIKYSAKPIVVDLWAPWCKPCLAMAPAFKEISQKYKGEVEVLKINADESPEVMKALNVMSIPTTIGFSQGNEILRRSGMQTPGMLDFFFTATKDQKKPAVMPPAPAARVVSILLGTAVILFGWFSSRSIVLIAIGGIILFTAFYDRCPIIKAIAPKIKALFQKKSAA